MFSYAYLLLKQRLQAEVDNLANVEWYKEQDTAKAKGAIKVLPAVYLKFHKATLKNLSLGVQEGVVQFDAILMTDCMKDGDDRIVDPTNTFDNLSMATNVFKALNGYGAWLSDLPQFDTLKGTENDFKMFNSIQRVSIEPDHRMDAIMVTTQTFQFYVKDYSGFDKFTTTTATLNIANFEI